MYGGKQSTNVTFRSLVSTTPHVLVIGHLLSRTASRSTSHRPLTLGLRDTPTQRHPGTNMSWSIWHTSSPMVMATPSASTSFLVSYPSTMPPRERRAPATHLIQATPNMMADSTEAHPGGSTFVERSLRRSINLLQACSSTLMMRTKGLHLRPRPYVR